MATLPESTPMQIGRPELFIKDGVMGYSLPRTVEQYGFLSCRWSVCVQFEDGRRELVDLTEAIDLGAGGKLWLLPQPGGLTPDVARRLDRWSPASINEWLEGADFAPPAHVFEALCGRIEEFIDFPTDRGEPTAAILALWIMLTYVYPAWDALPYLHVTGPLGSGKSRVFEILDQLAFRPLLTSNITAATLYRTLDSQGGTLLLDEAERLKQPGQSEGGDIVQMLLAGYKRTGRAIRLDGASGEFRTVEFDVYGPKALAGISGIPTALLSRCITISMIRSGPGSVKPRRRVQPTDPVWQGIRDQLYCMALSLGAKWLELAGNAGICPDTMNGRQYELWQPLLAIASLVDEDGSRGLVRELAEYAVQAIEDDAEDLVPESDALLLRKLVDLWRNSETPTASEALEMLQKDHPVLFRYWSPKTIAKRLRDYGLPRAIKRYSRREYSDISSAAWKRIELAYGIDLGFGTEKTQKTEIGGGGHAE